MLYPKEKRVSLHETSFGVEDLSLSFSLLVEMQDMARFFEKHRLTRERLESSASLLLDKLKMLSQQAQSSGKKKNMKDSQLAHV